MIFFFCNRAAWRLVTRFGFRREESRRGKGERKRKDRERRRRDGKKRRKTRRRRTSSRLRSTSTPTGTQSTASIPRTRAKSRARASWMTAARAQRHNNNSNCGNERKRPNSTKTLRSTLAAPKSKRPRQTLRYGHSAPRCVFDILIRQQRYRWPWSCGECVSVVCVKLSHKRVFSRSSRPSPISPLSKIESSFATTK